LKIDRAIMNLAELKVFSPKNASFNDTAGKSQPARARPFTDCLGGHHLDEELESGIRWKNCPKPTSSTSPGDTKGFTAASWWNGWITSNTCTQLPLPLFAGCSAPIPSGQSFSGD